MTSSYPGPTTTGKIPFTPPGTDLKYETFYQLWGTLSDTASPVLICLHGGPGTPGRYLQPLGSLNATSGIPVLLYDQIGCGESTHLRDKKGDTSFWTFPLFIAELLNLITHFNINTYSLFGHSWGGMLAARFALTQPRGLRKLILASTTASIKLRLAATARQRLALPTPIRQTLESCEELGTTTSPEYRLAQLEFLKRHLCRLDPFPPELQQSMAYMSSDDTVYSTIYGPSVLELTGPLADFDITNELHQITETTVPGGILIVNGKYDTTQDEVTSAFFTETRARVKWVRFAESGHMAMLEEREGFGEVVRGFLEMR